MISLTDLALTIVLWRCKDQADRYRLSTVSVLLRVRWQATERGPIGYGREYSPVRRHRLPVAAKPQA
jgi:hypothetical protein